MQEWMRQVDRWLGGLLVILLAPLALLWRRSPLPHRPGFGPNPPPTGRPAEAGGLTPHPVIAVSKYFGMGSIILAVPLLRAIRRQYPTARLIFVSFASHRELLAYVPYVDQVLTIRTSPLGFIKDTLKVLWRLRRTGVDLFFDLEFFSRYSALMNFWSGAAVRVGFHTLSLASRGRLLTHRVYWNQYRHAADNFLALGQAVGIPDGDRTLELCPLTPADARDAQIWLQQHGLTPHRYVVFNPHGYTLPHLNAYPAAHWRTLAEVLHQRSELHVVYVGVSADHGPGSAEILIPDRQPHIHNVIGQTTFNMLIALLQSAACVISVDSGIAHLAAVQRVPTLTFFGPDSPTVYQPLNARGEILYQELHCSPCVNLLQGKESDCRDNVCINRWTPEALVERVMQLLERA